MIFFSRRLYAGIQPDSGWERRAEREWERRRRTYGVCLGAIRPYLPPGPRRLGATTLHDGVVIEARMKGKKLRLLVDATSALGSYSGQQVELVFANAVVPAKAKLAGLTGRWWLYEEWHLAKDDRFSLHLLFDEGELEVEASGMSLRHRRVRKPGAPSRRSGR